MNIAVLVWWFLGTPTKWYLEHFRVGQENRLLMWTARRRQHLQRALFMSADTQAVTGIALTTAGLIQIWELPIYHLAVILDLLSISANSQAVMLLYGMRQKRAIRKREGRPRPSLVDPRLFVSVTYVSIYFAFAGLTYQHFDDPEPDRDCLLNYPPQFGNYGKWSLAEATLMLVIYVLAYAQDLVPESWLQVDDRNAPRLLRWLYDGFLPIFTLTYFLWNIIDLVTLKSANRSILNDDAEDKIEAFGQVVPIVLLLLVLLSLWELWTSEGEELDGRPASREATRTL